MGSRLSNLPGFVSPAVPAQIRQLETGNPGVVSTIRKFLEGAYDPTAVQFEKFLNIGQARVNRATDDLKNAILATQGAQRVYGGAAGRQLNRALIDKIKDDLDREQMFLLDTLNKIVENRQFGVQAGQNTLDSSRKYALAKADMRNKYNLSAWMGDNFRRADRRASARTLRNLLTPSAVRSAEVLGSVAGDLLGNYVDNLFA